MTRSFAGLGLSYATAPDSWFEMTACLRAPDVAAGTAAVAAMLRSLRIARGH